MFFLSHFSKQQFVAVVGIISRNVFLLINGIIFAVVIFLVILGDTQEGIFLGLITVLNIVIGCVQEINAWLNLEKLQLLAAPKVTRINEDGSETIILAEEVKEKDKIKLKNGDQIPCDGVLISSHEFEVSEALITGESNAFLKKLGDKALAGSIVTSGSGILEVEKVFAESRIALMTKSIKRYSLILSPIQHSINIIIKYTGYALIFIILFVIGRGLLINESTLNIVQNIGALTSALLPQGMVVIMTLLFSYGGIHLYRKNVLLQQVNATEKLARIKNLCMDKTGTLTDNNLVVEHMYIAPNFNEKKASESIGAYVNSTEDSSLTIGVIKKMFTSKYSGTTIDSLGFSSSRQFGAVHVKDDFGERIILVGAPDILLPYLSTAQEREWLQKYIDIEAKIGKRLICFTESDMQALPQTLVGIKLSAISVFVLSNNLREGVKEAIEFFQTRGVVIRIISGDNPETVQFIATTAGVNNSHNVITGAELESWTEPDYLKNVSKYIIFARIKPEQKEKIIEALKHDGFTAMIGDGANDALAIKKSDLGIAMFDGAQATRQIASVVLVKNSFTDLPNGVKLADSIIQNIEICASIFFSQVFLGFFFFVIISVLGYSFPFTPLNITFINYFTIGLPGAIIFWWIIQPVRQNIVRHSESFLRQVIPFAFVSAIPQALVVYFAFYIQGISLVLIAFIIVGVIFFMFTPSVYSGPLTKIQKRQFLILVFVEIVSISILINIPIVTTFYNLQIPSLRAILGLIPVLIIYTLVQYSLIRWFFKIKLPTQSKA